MPRCGNISGRRKGLGVCGESAGLNVAIKTGMRTPIANKAKIRALEEKAVVAEVRGQTDQFAEGRAHQGRENEGRQRRSFGRCRDVTRARRRAKVSAIDPAAAFASWGFIRSGWLPAIQTLSALKLKAKSARLGGDEPDPESERGGARSRGRD
jgi:hypothetical protein